MLAIACTAVSISARTLRQSSVVNVSCCFNGVKPLSISNCTSEASTACMAEAKPKRSPPNLLEFRRLFNSFATGI
eukprot:6464524-Amphidinium_carterae.1